MINLDLKDLLKDKIYIVRYLGKQHFKTSSITQVQQLKKALKVLGITDYHIYVVNVRKES